MFPASFRNTFNPFSSLVTNSTRSAEEGKYIVPYSRTKLRQNALKVQAIKLYNDFLLPLNLIHQCNTLLSFKIALKDILS